VEWEEVGGEGVTEQEKREKVINGLQEVIDCESIVYLYRAKAIECAIEMLKAQEPRVMTLDEVKAAAGHDVWLELSGNIADDVLFAATIEGCGIKGLCTRYESLNYSAYGIRPYGWRCWTSRPTEKQRQAVKWD